MAGTLGRNFNRCFKKEKPPETRHSSSLPEDHSRSSTASTSILIKNFNSLYDLTLDCTFHPKCPNFISEPESTTPDLSSVFASQRFFFSSPGRSNSIIESSFSSSSVGSSSSPTDPPESETLVGGGIAIPTYSPDPYMDFRRSMQEMVEARHLFDVGANWDHLHELLTCYLSLNPKSTHKFIVGAFADLLVTLMATSSAGKSGRKPAKFAGGLNNIAPRCM